MGVPRRCGGLGSRSIRGGRSWSFSQGRSECPRSCCAMRSTWPTRGFGSQCTRIIRSSDTAARRANRRGCEAAGRPERHPVAPSSARERDATSRFRIVRGDRRRVWSYPPRAEWWRACASACGRAPPVSRSGRGCAAHLRPRRRDGRGECRARSRHQTTRPNEARPRRGTQGVLPRGRYALAGTREVRRSRRVAGALGELASGSARRRHRREASPRRP
jgi:hypothetical protein